MKRIIIILILLMVLTIIGVSVTYTLWEVDPATTTGFDTGTNGVWVGHQWYSGCNVRTGKPIGSGERDAFITKLYKYGIKDVFIHAGPVGNDGGIPEMPSIFFDSLRSATPGMRYIPWIGGNANVLPLGKAEWRTAFIETLGELYSRGFTGVHLDIEPLVSYQSGYLELLKEIGNVFEDDYFISHATRRLDVSSFSIPGVSNHFWSEEFYGACMDITDQTVLMGYDTCIKFKKVYRWYIRYQTGNLLEIASGFPRHRVMIGVPSYEDVPRFSDPDIENITNAAAGVRVALESAKNRIDQFDGIAVYACWTTDSLEWKDYEVYWMGRY